MQDNCGSFEDDTNFSPDLHEYLQIAAEQVFEDEVNTAATESHLGKNIFISSNLYV